MNLFCPSKPLVLTWVGLGRIIRGPFDLVLLRTGLEKPTGFLCVCLSTENVVVAWSGGAGWGSNAAGLPPLFLHESAYPRAEEELQDLSLGFLHLQVQLL